jgi:hypothetical protein
MSIAHDALPVPRLHVPPGGIAVHAIHCCVHVGLIALLPWSCAATRRLAVAPAPAASQCRLQAAAVQGPGPAVVGCYLADTAWPP